MKRYLFLGGPWDGRWTHTDGGMAWLMPNPDVPLEAFPPSLDQHTLYHRARLVVPGWLIPITVYTTDPLHHRFERGTVLPGSVWGVRPDRSSTTGLHTYRESAELLMRAAREHNHRRMTR